MAGRFVRVEYDTSAGSAVLRRELSRYPAAEPAAEPDVTIRYRPVDTSDRTYVNPKSHEEVDGGFVMRHRMATVRFHLEGRQLTGADFRPSSASSRLLVGARRMLDMQYSSREERSGVIFHELVLVPAMHWMPDLLLVHASTFSDDAGRVTLIGGTGGVGKTSLAMELCLKHGFRFAGDDIAVVDAGGHVWPNLAYPKIYAYNVEGNPALYERLLGGRGRADRLHWHVHRWRGGAAVRRRIAPDELYGTYDAEGGPLGRYVILVREERSQIGVSEIDPSRAASMSVSLMLAEYYPFHNHLHWHAFNRLAAGREPSATIQNTVERWEAQFRDVLEATSCLLVRVPVAIDHDAFKREMAALLT